MSELDLEKLPIGTSTHIRLFSGDVKNFDLFHFEDKTVGHYYLFGFTMKKDDSPRIQIDGDETRIAVELDQKGLESLITFLNKLCKDLPKDEKG